MTTEEVREWIQAGVSAEDINLVLAHEEIGTKDEGNGRDFCSSVEYAKSHQRLQYCRNSTNWLISRKEYVLIHKEFGTSTQEKLLQLLESGQIEEYHHVIQQLDEMGIWKVDVDIDFIWEKVNHDFQRTLLGYLKDKQYDNFEDTVNWLNSIWVWDSSIDAALAQGNYEDLCVYETDRFDEDGKMVTLQMGSTKERREHIIADVLDFAEEGKDVSVRVQYSGTALILRKFFYNLQEKLLLDLDGKKVSSVDIKVANQENWTVKYWSEKHANVYETLEPFDCAVLDVFFTLYCYGVRIVTVNQVDKLLSGNTGRHSSEQKIARILESIDRLSSIHFGFTIRGISYKAARLLDVDCFHRLTDETGTYTGTYIYIHGINSIYQYARDMHQVANTPKEYYDTSNLPKEYQFEDTETAIVLKRRIITKVMGIIWESTKKGHKFKHWNRVALIQKDRNNEGVFPELGLMPDTEGKTRAESKELLDKWRRKEKPKYIKIVKGTLENLKANYAILDYEEYREKPTEPVLGYDIICFTKTETNALKGMRDDLKPTYVKNLLAKRQLAKGE